VKKLLTMVLVLSIIGMIFGSCDSSSKTEVDNSYGDLKYIAETYVSDYQLKSPSSAKFDNNAFESNITELGGNRYQYKGWVDSQNGFGADVRTTFTIIARHEGGDKWVVESFDSY